MTPCRRLFPFALSLLWIINCVRVHGFELPIVDSQYNRQLCSGMRSSDKTHINVSFDATSQGTVAMVIYRWEDSAYLGKVTSPGDENTLPKTYICTTSSLNAGFCSRNQLGRFILDLPPDRPINQTSFWSARVDLSGNGTDTTNQTINKSSFWDNPEGNPTPPESNYTSPWRRAATRDVNPNSSPSGLLHYHEPIQYLVRKTGYYCVAVVPVTVRTSQAASTDVPYHPPYKGFVTFQNTFDGKLAATDYPKVNFYLFMFLLYVAIGAAWGVLCYRHMNELLPIQYYLSSLVGLLVIEMIANWAYYRYLNAHGRGTTSTIFLLVCAILGAGRGALSFFLLLVVSLGLSVVRESLGRTMLKCQLLAGAHFVFGVLYSVGIVELELESTSALVLLLFVIPLAFTLSGFLLWIMYSLNATIAQLRARKQRYKLSMFERLYHILLVAVVIIFIFFVVSSLSFSGRLAEDYAAKSWKYRWILLDGWLAVLYLLAFSCIAFLWRPLIMSDELAQDEADAEDYDLEAMNPQRDDEEDDDATLVGGRRDGHVSLPGEDVVFSIDDGEEDNEAEDDRHKSGEGGSNTGRRLD